MAWGGHYAGQWQGGWFGALGTAPGALYGSTVVTFTAVGHISGGGAANISGAASIHVQAYAVLVLPADRFNWQAVLRGPAGRDNAALGRMALRTRRR